MVPDLVGSPKRAVSDYFHDTVFGAYAYSHLHLWPLSVFHYIPYLLCCCLCQSFLSHRFPPKPVKIRFRFLAINDGEPAESAIGL